MAYWYVTFNYKFTNQGNIPALIMSNARDTDYATSISQFDGMYGNWIPADIEANKGRRFEVVKANGGVTETFIADRHVPDLGGFHGPAREGQTQLYFGGTVIYQGVNGGAYASNFCYVWMFPFAHAIRADGGKSCTNSYT